MNRIFTATAMSVCLLAAPASAGSLNDPVIENDLIATDAATSSVSGVAIVLMLAVLLTAAAAN